MDSYREPPKTRKESKKDQREKSRGKTVYSAKHIRQQEALIQNKKKWGAVSQNKKKRKVHKVQKFETAFFHVI